MSFASRVRFHDDELTPTEPSQPASNMLISCGHPNSCCFGSAPFAIFRKDRIFFMDSDMTKVRAASCSGSQFRDELVILMLNFLRPPPVLAYKRSCQIGFPQDTS